jgi:hypothetical protein
MTSDEYPYASPPGARQWQPPLSPAPTASGSHPGFDDKEHEAPELAVPQMAVIIASVVALLAISNATMAPVGSSIRPGPGFVIGLSYVATVLGSIGAQAVLMTILLVFAQGPLWQRLAWHWGLAGLALVAWCLGFALAEAEWIFSYRFPVEELTVLVTGLPLVSLMCQAPMWLFRFYLHWRIEPPGHRRAVVQRLSIRDFLIGTILAAVTMALVRLGKPWTMDESEYWAAWSIASAAIAGNSLICVLPIIYLTLGVRRPAWGAAGVLAMIVAAASVGSWVSIRFDPAGPSDAEKTLIVTTLAVSSASFLAGTLWLVRAYGYRLITGRTELQSVQQ